jgi:hypothetical protein
MIKSICGGSLFNISGAYNNSIYIDNYKLQQGLAGQVRYTGNDFEVNDGNSWRPLVSSQIYMDMSKQAQDAFQWAIRKMAEEQEAQTLAKDHPAVQIALENLEKARQQLNATILLSKENNESTS